MQIRVKHSEKSESRTPIRLSHATAERVPKDLNVLLLKGLLSHVHGHALHKSEKIEKSQMPSR